MNLLFGWLMKPGTMWSILDGIMLCFEMMLVLVIIAFMAAWRKSKKEKSEE